MMILSVVWDLCLMLIPDCMVLRCFMMALILTIGDKAQMIMMFGSLSLHIVIRVDSRVSHSLSVVFFCDSTVM